MEDPFARRDSISRTPPVVGETPTEQVTKRKKQYLPEENNEKNTNPGEILEKAIQKISRDLKTLGKIVSKLVDFFTNQRYCKAKK